MIVPRLSVVYNVLEESCTQSTESSIRVLIDREDCCEHAKVLFVQIKAREELRGLRVEAVEVLLLLDEQVVLLVELLHVGFHGQELARLLLESAALALALVLVRLVAVELAEAVEVTGALDGSRVAAALARVTTRRVAVPGLDAVGDVEIVVGGLGVWDLVDEHRVHTVWVSLLSALWLSGRSLIG